MAIQDQYIKRILNARVYDVAVETPLERALSLSSRLQNSIWLKRESLQQVFSFKLRGAYNKMALLGDEEHRRGVITASAGNHAQGVALAATRLGLNALIIMPSTTPNIKVQAVQRMGAMIELHGNTYNEAYEHARRRADETGMTFIHPYDDPDVIAGQGTIALEILHQHRGRLDAIFVPVGGGGLIAGIAAYVKYLRPEVKVIGIEPDDAPCMYEALRVGERVVLDQVGIFADGVAVVQAGEEPFRIARECVDEIVLVSTDEICAAIKDIFEDTRSITEPAGALAVAGIKRYVSREGCTDQSFVGIDSGANINFDRLRYVAERAELGEQRESLLAVTIAEQPGSFRRFCEMLGTRAITEFNYRYSDSIEAHIFVGVQLSQGLEEKAELIAMLRAAGYQVTDLSDNEMAKLHIRHMVGGRAAPAHERLIRFEFPERPGALLRFLNHIGTHWNISMFHYRNHGAAYGRVLAGIQVPESDSDAFADFLKRVGYPFWKETDNVAYRLFLRDQEQ